MVVAACLTLSAQHLLVWSRQRAQWAYLLFALAAIGTAVLAAAELAMMRAVTPVQFGVAVRWLHVPAWICIVALVWFAWHYLQAGRLWLAWTITGLRTLALVLNFIFSPNLNYRSITAVRQIPFLGDYVSVADSVSNPWMLVGQLGLVLWVVFVLDATRTVWLRGDRARALRVGGSMSFFVIAGTIQAILVLWGIVHTPITASLFYMGIIAAMAYELSSDVLRAGQLSRDLLESQRRMRLAAIAADLSLWEWDIGRDEIWVTEKGRERAGVDESERINFDRFLESIHPDDRDPTRRAARRAMEGQGEYEAEYRMTAPGGATRCVSARGHVERDANGRPLRIRGVSLDITDRKRAEEEAAQLSADLRESEARIAQASEAAGFGVWMWTAASDRVWGSEQSRRMFEISPDEEVSFETVIQRIHPDDRERVVADRRRAMETGDPYSTEYRVLLRNGGERWIASRGRYFSNGDGKPTRMLGTVVDITERRRAEEEIAQQHSELMHLSRVAVLGELSGALAHELNQPLAAILSNAQAANRFIAAGSVDTAELSEILDDIIRDDQRASEVIRSLRSLAGRSEVTRERCGINDLIQRTAGLLKGELLRRGVTMQRDLDPSAPIVDAVAVELQQVLINLVLNAADAMAETPPDQRSVTLRTVQRGGTVDVTVEDRGCGLPPGRDIFKAFVTTKETGLGMGLAICQRILEHHGGRLRAENRPEGGAVFTVSLPVVAR